MEGFKKTLRAERSPLRTATSALLLAGAAAALALVAGGYKNVAQTVVWDHGFDFFKEFAIRPGGVLEYVGLFLTRTFLTPPLGIALLLLVFVAICVVCRNAAGPDSIVAMLPAACIMFFLAGPQFGLQGGADKGWIFSLPLGCLAAVSAVSAFRNCRIPWIYAIIVAVVGYYLCGAYGLIAAIAIALMAFGTKHMYTTAVSVCFAVALPFAYQKIPHPQIAGRHAWMGGLPLVVCIVVLVAMLLVALCTVWRRRPAAKPGLSFVVGTILSVAMVGCALFTYYI